MTNKKTEAKSPTKQRQYRRIVKTANKSRRNPSKEGQRREDLLAEKRLRIKLFETGTVKLRSGLGRL